MRDQLTRNRIRVIAGEGMFEGPDVVRVDTGGSTEELKAEHIVIATGTKPARPSSVSFDPGRVIDSDGLLEATRKRHPSRNFKA